MPDPVHAIGTQIFDLEYRSDRSPEELQNRVSKLQSQGLESEMERLFNRLVPDSSMLRIKNLELDLGEIQEDDLERHFVSRVLEELEIVIRRRLAMHEEPADEFELDESPASESEIGILMRFLETGALPWAVPHDRVDLDGLIMLVASSRSRALSLRLRSTRNSRQVVFRLVHQFTEDSIKGVIGVLDPVNSERVIQYVDALSDLKKGSDSPSTEMAAYRKQLWSIVLSFYLVQRGTFHNNVVFLASTVKAVAASKNLDYLLLLNDLLSAAMSNSSFKKRNENFVKTLRAVQDLEKQKGNVDLPITVEQRSDVSQMLSSLFSNQSLGGVFPKNLILKSIIDRHDHWHSEIGSLIVSEGAIDRFVSQGDEALFSALVGAIRPRQKQFILSLAETLSVLHRKSPTPPVSSDVFERVKWGVIFKVMMVDRGSVFNNKSFTRGIIMRMSTANNMAVNDLLAILNSDEINWRAMNKLSILKEVLEDFRAKLAPVDSSQELTNEGVETKLIQNLFSRFFSEFQESEIQSLELSHFYRWRSEVQYLVRKSPSKFYSLVNRLESSRRQWLLTNLLSGSAGFSEIVSRATRFQAEFVDEIAVFFRTLMLFSDRDHGGNDSMNVVIWHYLRFYKGSADLMEFMKSLFAEFKLESGEPIVIRSENDEWPLSISIEELALASGQNDICKKIAKALKEILPEDQQPTTYLEATARSSPVLSSLVEVEDFLAADLGVEIRPSIESSLWAQAETALMDMLVHSLRHDGPTLRKWWGLMTPRAILQFACSNEYGKHWKDLELMDRWRDFLRQLRVLRPGIPQQVLDMMGKSSVYVNDFSRLFGLLNGSELEAFFGKLDLKIDINETTEDRYHFVSDHLSLLGISSTQIAAIASSIRDKSSESIEDAVCELYSDYSRFEVNKYLKRNPRNKELMEKPGLTADTIESLDSKLSEEGHFVIIENAGAVILWPYLQRLFSMLNYTDKSAFVSHNDALRAMHLIQFICTAKEGFPEYELVLNKILCGIDDKAPIPVEVLLSEEERSLATDLTQGVIGNWPALKSTSAENFRSSFLLRKGVLTEHKEHYLLKVEKVGYDILLDSLPWSISHVFLPWMNKSIQVKWL